MAVHCGACGATLAGRFCANCGTPAPVGVCASCGARPAPGARFCASCGVPLGGAPPQPAAGGGSRPDRPLLPLAVAGVAVLAVVLVVLLRARPAPPAMFAGPVPAASGAPDISMMGPREQFDRLYERVMTASERNDTTEAARFAPMALMAYRNLPPEELDADARFHAAMIRLHTGDIAGARALADSMLAAEPDHLFGYVVQNGVGRFTADDALVARTYREFLVRVEAERRTLRPEYQAHQTMLDSFQQAARAAAGGQ
jgi:hypothetical protein